MEKKKRGGARKGSGRKRTGNVSLCIRMPKETVDYIKQKSKEENIPLGSWIAKRIGRQKDGEHAS